MFDSLLSSEITQTHELFKNNIKKVFCLCFAIRLEIMIASITDTCKSY